MNIPKDLKYTKDHEWAKVEGNIIRAGITDYAQDELGDIVYVEFNEKGSKVKQGGVFGTVESVKAVSELYAPASGTIVEINEALMDSPETINQDPYEKAWMVLIDMEKPSEIANLMGAEEYEAYVSKESK